MHLLQGLALLAMHFSFHFRLYTSRARRTCLLLLSHGTVCLFYFAQMPQVPWAPTVVLQEMEQLFLHQQPDYLSFIWRHLFSSFLWRVLQSPQPMR